MDYEKHSHLNKCINFWQPYKLVVVPGLNPSKCLYREWEGRDIEFAKVTNPCSQYILCIHSVSTLNYRIMFQYKPVHKNIDISVCVWINLWNPTAAQTVMYQFSCMSKTKLHCLYWWSGQLDCYLMASITCTNVQPLLASKKFLCDMLMETCQCTAQIKTPLVILSVNLHIFSW